MGGPVAPPAPLVPSPLQRMDKFCPETHEGCVMIAHSHGTGTGTTTYLLAISSLSWASDAHSAGPVTYDSSQNKTYHEDEDCNQIELCHREWRGGHTTQEQG